MNIDNRVSFIHSFIHLFHM